LKVLWLCRHYPKRKQIHELKRIFGEDVEIVQVVEKVSGAGRILELMKEYNCDEVVVNVPDKILSGLLSKGVRPIRAIMQRTINRNYYAHPRAKYTFRHICFERVHKYDVRTERLDKKSKRRGVGQGGGSGSSAVQQKRC